MQRSRSVGILGGTFNPPHLGHLALARHALASLRLDGVVLIPASSAPHKLAEPDAGPQHRLHMCELLVRDDAKLSACALEIERGGASYTVDTLSSINASHPDAELTFIVGADTASTMPGWREPARVLELAQLAVATRAGTGREHVLASLEQLGSREHVKFLDMPAVEVSSAAVRRRVALGQPVEELVGAQVAGYIAEQRLYRDLPAGAK